MEVIDLPVSPSKVTFEKIGIVTTEYFDSERKFRHALERHKHFLLYSMDEILWHERAHVETARNLGYHAQYCLSNNGTQYQPGALINGGHITDIPIDDLIAIISAPGQLGDDDKLKLLYLMSFKRFYKD